MLSPVLLERLRVWWRVARAQGKMRDGGGMSPDRERWVACRRGFFSPARVLSRLFRRRLFEALEKLHRDGQLQFSGEHGHLADAGTFSPWLPRCATDGWCTPSARSPAPRQCWRICRAIPTSDDLEPASGFDERGRCDIPLEGLPRQGAYSATAQFGARALHRGIDVAVQMLGYETTNRGDTAGTARFRSLGHPMYARKNPPRSSA